MALPHTIITFMGGLILGLLTGLVIGFVAGATHYQWQSTPRPPVVPRGGVNLKPRISLE
jgi:hypothetical protein